MQHIVFIDQAKYLHSKDGCLAINTKDDSLEILHTDDILTLIIDSVSTTISTQAFLLCQKANVPIIICNGLHQPEFYCLDLFRHHQLLNTITKQISWSKSKKQEAWKLILFNKLLNHIKAIDHLKPNHKSINKINNNLEKLQKANFPHAINSCESISARIYFNTLFDDGFKRFQDDALNYALNYGYAIIRSLIMNFVVAKGLHPALGIWHQSSRNRFNLADDIIESLRIIVDIQVYKMDIKDSFDFHQKQQLLKILHAHVYIKNKKHTLKYAIKTFIDSLNSFMNEKSQKLDLIEVRPNELY